MEEEKMIIKEEKSTNPESDINLKVKLGDPFLFDGEEVKEIDLKGLFDLTASDLCEIDRQMKYTGTNTEATRQYAMFVAAKVNGKPWEFCNNMKARDSIRLRNVVTTFFYA